jgi:hypothetical protein
MHKTVLHTTKWNRILGMVSEEEIKKWATAIAAQSRLKLTHFGQSPAIGASRAKTQVAFENNRSAYHVWILPELNMIILDVFHKSVETDEQLFRGEITLRSLERISRILSSLAHSGSSDPAASGRRERRFPDRGPAVLLAPTPTNIPRRGPSRPPR